MHRCMLTHVMWKFEIDMSEVFIHNQSLLQLTFSSSSIIASFSARVDLAHFSWMAFGTWQRPDGFSSHSLLRRFSFAPSVWGTGRSAGGWTPFTATFSFFSVCFVLVAGVPAGEGAGIFGVGVAVELLDRLLSARSFCISIIIALCASQRIKDTKGTKIENTKLKVNKYMISYQYDISVWHRLNSLHHKESRHDHDLLQLPDELLLVRFGGCLFTLHSLCRSWVGRWFTRWSWCICFLLRRWSRLCFGSCCCLVCTSFGLGSFLVLLNFLFSGLQWTLMKIVNRSFRLFTNLKLDMQQCYKRCWSFSLVFGMTCALGRNMAKLLVESHQ